MNQEQRAAVAETFGVEPEDVTDEQFQSWKRIGEGYKAVTEPEADAEEEEVEEEEAEEEDEQPEVPAEVVAQVAALGERITELEAESEASATQVKGLERKLAEKPLVTDQKPQFPLTADVITEPAEAQTSDPEMQRNIRELQSHNDSSAFLCAILTMGGKREYDPRETGHWKRWVKEHGHWGEFVDKYKGFQETLEPEHKKATLTTSTGSDYVPTILSDEFTRTMRHPMQASASVRQMVMTSKVVDLPGEGADVAVYKRAEAATGTQSDTDDRKTTLTAINLMAYSKLTSEIDEDSIIPALELVKEKQAYAMGEAIEFATVHGDTDDTQGQSNNTTMTQYTAYDAWNGLHAQAVAASTAEIAVGGTRWDGEDALGQIDALNTFAQPDQCAWLMHPVQWSRTRVMSDYMSTGYRNLILVPGGALSPITGMPVDDLFGFPILRSGQVAKNNSTTGYYDGSTTDRTQVYLYNHRAFILGDRKRVTVETDKTIESQTIKMVTVWRGHFACLYASTDDCISAAINIDYDAAPA